MIFSLFITIVVFQRVTELIIAKRNEGWMKKQGGIEFGQQHYWFIVTVHSLFIICLILEVIIFEKEPSSLWPFLGSLFILTQLARVWALFSLGKYWNTKIIVVPNAKVIKKGPYVYLKHPNYLIVSLELIIIPLLFNAFWTTILFSLLNAVILMIRIPAEEKALSEHTEYQIVFNTTRRLLRFSFLKKM